MSDSGGPKDLIWRFEGLVEVVKRGMSFELEVL